LRLVSGGRWRYGFVLADPWALAAALQVGAGSSSHPAPPSRATLLGRARVAVRHARLDHPLAKFVLLPLALALPAFRLHQRIAFGSSFGEYYSFGLAAYLKAFALWWAAWAMGVVLVAAALRAAIELGTLLVVLVRPTAAIEVRRWLERLGLALVYLGLPGWLLLRLLAQ
jgi:apolipoprotein N-acyltransferase